MLTQSHAAELAAHGYAVRGPDPRVGPGPPSIFVWRYSGDGVFDSPVFGVVRGYVAPWVRPVTEPADSVAAYRRVLGVADDRPIYTGEYPRLRVWSDGESWFVDDMQACWGGRPLWQRQFLWAFQSLDEVIAALPKCFVAAGQEPAELAAAPPPATE